MNDGKQDFIAFSVSDVFVVLVIALLGPAVVTVLAVWALS